jgi:hypothetical protein
MPVLIIAALIVFGLAAGGADQGEPGPRLKGEPYGEYEVHPDYPTTVPPDARSEGRWIVHHYGEDTADPAAPYLFAVCWTDSDFATFREVVIDQATYDTYVASRDLGQYPCPG